MTVPTVIAGQVKHLRTTVEQPYLAIIIIKNDLRMDGDESMRGNFFFVDGPYQVRNIPYRYDR